MIQDIAPHTYHNEYRPVAPDGSSFVLAYENGKSFFHKMNTKQKLHLKTVPDPLTIPHTLLYLLFWTGCPKVTK